MKDRFKFRVWNIERKKYEDLTRQDVLYFIDTSGQLNRVIVYGPSDDIPCDTHFFTKPLDKYYKVEFCTGLKDKHGILIYEGDIVRTKEMGKAVKYNGKNVVVADYENYVIVYKEAAFYMKNPNTYGSILGYFSDKESKLEVIGNIYETPELLEVNCNNGTTTNTFIF